ncbi:STAS domain-containing protein [Streptomyces sp. NPDC056480]|uniref:STAS domain-containing protein n=1 Tax=Streptomyces sp. NPDC056480 TaxID=3345833 RepID=UPI003689518C
MHLNWMLCLRHAVVTVAGDLDIHTAQDVRQVLTAAVAVYEETVLDLACLGFCDCVGLGALIAAGRAARCRGALLYLRNVPGCLERLARANGTSPAAVSHTPGALDRAVVSPRPRPGPVTAPSG